MNRNPFTSLLSLLLIVSVLGLFGCKKDDGGTTPPSNADIPADPGGTAPATTINNVTPAATFAKTPGNEGRVKINLLGVIDPGTGLPIVFSLNKPGGITARNLWVTEDNILKGIKLSSAGGGTQLTADVVFAVDNSGSMFEEADSVAAKIVAFANFLAASGLNLQVGVVGYDDGGDISGALNLTNAATLNAYLNRVGRTGTSRTKGFSGPDSARFQTAASSFASPVFGENGVVGVWFADSLFTFRSGANRVYVNFTDEPTQPNNQVYWSTQGLCGRWTPGKGTIHTVFSADTNRSWTTLVNERPWDLSACTGGTVKFVPSNAAGLDLTTLPVTGALANSALVEFLTSNPNAAHTVTITVKTSTADGKTTFQNITY